jgi:hypothetical protein
MRVILVMLTGNAGRRTERRTRVPADPSGVGCPPGERPWYNCDQEKTGDLL